MLNRSFFVPSSSRHSGRRSADAERSSARFHSSSDAAAHKANRSLHTHAKHSDTDSDDGGVDDDDDSASQYHHSDSSDDEGNGGDHSLFPALSPQPYDSSYSSSSPSPSPSASSPITASLPSPPSSLFGSDSSPPFAPRASVAPSAAPSRRAKRSFGAIAELAASSHHAAASSSAVATSSFRWAALSFSALLDSVHSRLPFVSSSSSAALAPSSSSAASSSSSSSSLSAGKRKRSIPSHHSAEAVRSLHISSQLPAVDANDSVVIDVRGSTRRQQGNNTSDRAARRLVQSSRTHSRQSSGSVKKRKMIHVLVVQQHDESDQLLQPYSDQHNNRGDQRSSRTTVSHTVQHRRRRGETQDDSQEEMKQSVDCMGAARLPAPLASQLLVPLSSVLIDPILASSVRPPLLALPACFPALDKFASSVASGGLQCLSVSQLEEVEAQLEADVYRSLAGVDRAIQRELDALVAAHGLTPPLGILSFRELVLRVLNANSSDRRLRKLCAMEPQWALYVLEALRVINTAQHQPTAIRTASASDDCVADSDPMPPTRVLRRRTRSSGDGRTADGCGSDSGGSSSSVIHRRAASDTSVAALCSTNSAFAVPHSFSLFVSSASGISYPLRCPLTRSFSAASESPLAAIVRFWLGSATSIHILLLSLFYLALLYTTDSASLRKAHFALALLHHPSFLADRSLLPLSHPQSMDRARRIASRSSEYCRELYYLLDSTCLSLIQHNLLPTLPFATFDEHALPQLPIEHTLGLR